MREGAARALSLAGLAAMLLAGCSLLPGRGDDDPGRRLRDKLPLTWMADVSCPGCTEHWMTLTLFGDGSFRLRDRYVGSSAGGVDEIFHDIGLWSLDLDDELRLTLRGASRTPRLLRLRADGDLQLLDDQGRVIRSIREYVLARQGRAEPLAGPMRLLGLYSAGADGAWFSECQTGQRWRIQASPRADEAARQYRELSARSGPGQPLLLTLSGRPGMPGQGATQSLDIDALERFWPGEGCRQALSPPAQPLLETNWVLIELRGEPVRASGISEPPQLKLRQGGRMTGTTGCNRLQAAYIRDGSRLSIPRPLITRMTCPAPLQQQEQALLALLRATRDYRVTGNILELRDGDVVLARFTVSEMQ